jgi:hypothetical protein
MACAWEKKKKGKMGRGNVRPDLGWPGQLGKPRQDKAIEGKDQAKPGKAKRQESSPRTDKLSLA